MFVETYRQPTAGGHSPVEHLIGFTSVNAGNLALHVPVAQGAEDEVLNHRAGIEECLGVPRGSTVYLNQIHSADVVHADSEAVCGWEDRTTDGVKAKTADAVISADGSRPLAIMVADCLPVVFSSSSGATAVAHAGRVGLVGGVLENTVEALREIDPEASISAWIGPAICGNCYEVPEHMRDELSQQHPSLYSETSWGTPALDLPRAATTILEGLNVSVHRSEICTLEDDRVYSHRRDGAQAGRCAGMILSSTPSVEREKKF